MTLFLIIAVTVAGVGFFFIRKIRADRMTAALEADERRMADAMQHDAVDDGFAHDVARARDEGV